MATQTHHGEAISPAINDQDHHHLEDEKAEIKHVDDQHADPGDVIMKSPFEDLSFRKTWVVFWKVALMCMCASFSAAAE